MKEAIAFINDQTIKEIIFPEREVLRLFDGGCQIPVGVYCKREENVFHLWASHATTWKDMPDRMYVRSNDPLTAIKTLVDNIGKHKPTSVFITREKDENSYFFRYLESKGFTVYGESLITFSPVDAGSLPDAEWLFFTSRNGVRFFFDQHEDAKDNTRIAVFGKGMGEELRSYGKIPDFTGSSGDPEGVAREFLSLHSAHKVVFPRASNSQRNIQKVLEREKGMEVTDYIIYQNSIRKNVLIPDANILVFTSSLNFDSYVKNKGLPRNQTLIAIGESTAGTMRTAGIRDPAIAYQPIESCLVDEVIRG
jgi:uroporphyrinogen-III synthase